MQISGRNFLPELCGEVHAEIVLSNAVPLALHNRALFEGKRRAERPAKAALRKKDARKTPEFAPLQRVGPQLGKRACRTH